MTVSNSDYYAMFPLQEVIFDKDTGDALAAGIVSFYSDPAFSIPKDVYEQSNAAPYSFINVGSVLVLSGIGSFIDGSGENFIPMLYPWELPPTDPAAPGDFEPYFITVDSSGLIRQFTVTNWPPNNFTTANPGETTTSVTQNILTNPQFAEVLFTAPPAGGGTVFTVSGSNSVLQIAPAWYVKTTGSGTVTVTQVSNSVQTPSEAPYYLDIVTSGLSAFMLYQRIDMSPRLLYGSSVSAYFEAATPDNTAILLTLNYAPSDGGTLQQLAQGTTTTNTLFTAISTQTNAVVLDATPVNTDNASGYVDIQLIPGTVNCSLNLTSFQVVGVPETVPATLPEFIQISTPQQISELYWYDKPNLFYKPIPSYLTAWDFPLNPYQIQGQGIFAANAGGANSAYYVADQTILFQTVTSAFTTQPATPSLSGLNITAASTSSFAIIQYVTGAVVQELLNQRLSVQIKCSKTGANLVGTVGLYWTGNAAVPLLPLSVFSSITAGVPSLTTGWVAVPRVLGSASFTTTTTSSSTPFSFNGFDASAITTTGAIHFAIGITFNTMTAGDVFTLNYCSLNGGDIATRPAPQTFDEVLRECQFYYEKSYDNATLPGAATVIGSRINPITALPVTGAVIPNAYAASFGLAYNTVKRFAPTVTIYSTSGASGRVLSTILNSNGSTSLDNLITLWTQQTTGTKAVDYIPNSIAALVAAPGNQNIPSAFIQYQYTLNAQLGVV